MSWVLESSGEATCMKDYVSMNAPVVELMTREDSALALQYLNPTLSQARVKRLYDQGEFVGRASSVTKRSLVYPVLATRTGVCFVSSSGTMLYSK